MRTRERSIELGLLVVALLAGMAGLLTVYWSRSAVLEPGSLWLVGVFVGVVLGAHLAVRRWAPLADPTLLPAAVLLSGIGLTIIYRLDPERAARQSLWLLVAIAGMVLLLMLMRSHRALERYRYLIGAAGVLMLVLTAGPLGTVINGAKLWIVIGPMQVQPGEFAKLAIVIFLAAYLREHRTMLAQRLTLRHAGPILLFWGGSLVLLAAMSDFGTSLLFFGTFMAMLWVAVGRLSYVLVGMGSFLAGSAAIYAALPYVRVRFDIWLEPWDDPQGSGYQLIQGLFAMADGGIFGRGLGQAYLVTGSGQTIIPDAQTDFIFAAMANELGFVGAVGVLMAFSVLVWRGMAIAGACTNGFSKLLAFGLTATFALQVVIIVGGVVRLLPLTGQTLPFISYGGSSVLANFLLIGLLLAISSSMAAQRRRVEAAAAGAPAARPGITAGAQP